MLKKRRKMAKERDELKLDGRTAFYAMMLNKMKEKAADLGYALAVHGSMINDMDLIAVPWVEDAKGHEELAKELSKLLEPTVWKAFHFKEREKKPHGRITYSMSIYSDWFVDLSIMPLQNQTKEVK